MTERTLSPEEKLRRAEEIYYRRRNSGLRKEEYTSLNLGEKRDYRLFKKMIKQIVVCLIIYLSFYILQNNNYIFSDNVLNKTKEILSYDINFNSLKEKTMNFFNNLRNNNFVIPTIPQNIIENGNLMNLENKIEEQNDLGEKTINTNNQEELYVEEASSISQVEEDANYISTNFSFIKPLNGKITSRFGTRNPTTEGVPKYHTGIDISANKGTKIVSSMEGKVTQVSDSGDYGKHLRIQKDDIITLYAHCNKIYVKEGDEIKQGQEIAEVGETGNVTGPHLHFEIRRGDEFVDPDSVLEFN